MSSKTESADGSLSSQANSQRKRKRKGLSKSVSCECNLYKEEKGITSLWYWSNYYKGLLWQHKHELEVWKAYARSLEYENTQILQELERQKELNRQREQYKYENGTSEASEEDESEDAPEEDEPEEDAPEENEFEENELEEDENSEDEEIEFEMSEEMIAYFEQSIRRKLELEQLKEEVKKEVKEEVEEVEEREMDVKDLQEAQDLREKEMKLLYGEGSCMIIGMETAVQLSYDKYCDLKSPPYWPNIPLNLTFS